MKHDPQSLTKKSATPPYVLAEMTRHGKRVYYFRRGDGRRIRLPDDKDSIFFSEAYQAALSGRRLVPLKCRPSRQTKRLYNENKLKIEDKLRRSLDASRKRAKEKGFEFELDWDWARQQIEQTNFCCCMTGIPFFTDTNAQSLANPYAPSIDRVDSKRGYTRDNCRVVIYAFNAMLMDWGLDVFDYVIANYLRKKSTEDRPEETA